MKTLFKIFFYLVLIIIVLGIGAYVTVRIMYPPSEIAKMAAEKVKEQTGKVLVISDMDITVFTGLGVKAAGVSIRNPGEATPLFQVEETAVKVKFLPLLTKKVEIASIEVINPEIYLHMNTNGTNNWMPPEGFTPSIKKEEKKESGEMKLPVDVSSYLTVKNLNLLFENDRENMNLKINSLNYDVDFKTDKEFNLLTVLGNLFINEIHFQNPEQNVSINDIKYALDVKAQNKLSLFDLAGQLGIGSISHNDFNLDVIHPEFKFDISANIPAEKMKINDMKFIVNPVNVDVAGEISGFSSSPKADITLNLNKMDFDKLLRIIPEDISPHIAKVKGSGWMTMNTNIKVEGKTADDVKINGTIKAGDVNVKHSDFPKGISNLNADISFTSDELNIQDLSLKIGSNPVNVKMLISNFKNPLIKGEAEAKINLGEIKEAAPLPKGLDLAGNIDFKISMNGLAKQPKNFNVDGVLTTKNIKIQHPAAGVPIVQKQGKVDFTQKSLSMKNYKIEMGNSDMTVDFTGSNLTGFVFKDAGVPNFDINLSSNLIDLNKILPQKKEEKEKAVQDKGDVLFEVPQLPRFTMNFSGKINKLVFDKLNIADIKARADYKNEVFDVSSYSMKMFNGSVSGDFKADIRNKETPDFGGKFSAVNITSEKVTEAFAQAVHGRIFGKTDLNSDFSFNGRKKSVIKSSLKAKADIKYRDGKFKNWPTLNELGQTLGLKNYDEVQVNDGKTDMRIENGRVYTDDRFELNDGELVTKGSVGFDKSVNYDVTYILSKSAASKIKLDGKLQKGIDFLKDDKGWLPLDFKLTGTVTKPKFTLNTKVLFKRIEEGLKQKAKDSVEDDLEKVVDEAEDTIKKFFE